jgi:mannitol-1-phosphate/altronate dehydrogenase
LLALGVAGWMRYVGGVDEQVMRLKSAIRCWL